MTDDGKTQANPDDEIDALRQQVHELRERIATRLRERPVETVKDHELRDEDGATVRLSQLFGQKRDLVVVHHMGRGCPTCTPWADGFNGLRTHLEDRFAFVVSTPDEPADQRDFAASRDWTFRMVSTAGSTFAEDLGFAGEHDGKPMLLPGFSAFQKTEDGALVRVGRDVFGPGDDYCATWPLMSALPQGQDDWWPKFTC